MAYTPTSIQVLTQKTPQQIVDAASATNTVGTSMAPNAPGAMQYSNGGQASMVPTIPSAPTAGVTTGAVPNPGETIAQTYARGQAVLGGMAPIPGASPAVPTAGSTASILGSGIYGTDPGTIDQYQKEPNPDEVRRQQMKLFQAQIDATNQAYDQILNNERLAGQGRLGTQRAMGARGGILGSDFGAAQRSNTELFNLGQQQGIQAERAAKIGAIMGEMRTAVSDELKAKREARQSGYDNYVAYLASADERKASNAQKAASAILQAGLDPAQMDPAELSAIAKEGGLTTDQIIYSYQQAKASQDAADAEAVLKGEKTQAEIDNLKARTASEGMFNLSEGQARYDANGNLIASKAKTYKPGEDGSTSTVNLTTEDKRTLLGGGWSEADISSIENDVRQNGLTEVIRNAKANGATDSQVKALEKAYGSTSTETGQFLTKDYFRTLFGEENLKKTAQEAGQITGGNDWIPFNEAGDVESYLTSLETTVNLYRQAGYTDKEILKMMQ